MVDIVAPTQTATRWRDPAGRVHAVDNAEVIGRKMKRWTRCGLYDVEANEGWHGDEAPTCRACRIWGEIDL